ILYIANGYYSYTLNNRYDRLNSEVKQLRTRSLSLSELRMTATRQSEIIRALREQGIEMRESVTPPLRVE
ncbi:MAG: ABC transporter permease, partial [Rikenellaceae bacterium]|nr:ABC transporter permease [Rikenellaceae bacterium]